MKPYIEFRETGNTLFDVPYGVYRKADDMIMKSKSSVFGLKFTFSSKEECERILHRITDACALFRFKSIGGWKKLLPEIEITKL